MTHNPSDPNPTPWLALRQSSGLSQREVERRLGWAKGGTNHGRLSLIERGVIPTREEDRQLRAFYAAQLIGPER